MSEGTRGILTVDFKKPWKFMKNEDKPVAESWPQPDHLEPEEASPFVHEFREQDDETITEPPFRPYFPPFSYEREKRWGTPPFRTAYGGRNDRFSYRRPPYRYDYGDEEESTPVIFWQTAGALLLVLLALAAFKTDHPYAERAKQIFSASLQKDYMLSALGTWYQEHLADKIALPVFSPSKSSVTPAAFVPPVQDAKWKKPFDARQQPVAEMAGKANADVRAAARGIIEKVDKNDAYGQYVIINHGEQNGETLYGHLGRVQVKVNDWVDAGQVIGQLENRQDADFLFGYMKNHQFVDPSQILGATQGASP
jgi:stage IV sporulation protein FA